MQVLNINITPYTAHMLFVWNMYLQRVSTFIRRTRVHFLRNTSGGVTQATSTLPNWIILLAEDHKRWGDRRNNAERCTVAQECRKQVFNFDVYKLPDLNLRVHSDYLGGYWQLVAYCQPLLKRSFRKKYLV